MPKGKYIVVEGLDGSGKTTQLERILTHLGTDVTNVREPGSTPMSEAIRTILKDSTIPRAAHTNMFLFSAARADLIDTVIRPAILDGKTVLSDRNWLSSVAYQSAEGADVSDIIRLSRLACGELFEPDLLLLIDANPQTCYKRLQARGGNETDFFDSKGEAYFTEVRDAYLSHVGELKAGHIIDGSKTQDDVWEQIHTILSQNGF